MSEKKPPSETGSTVICETAGAVPSEGDRPFLRHKNALIGTLALNRAVGVHLGPVYSHDCYINPQERSASINRCFELRIGIPTGSTVVVAVALTSPAFLPNISSSPLLMHRHKFG